MVNVGDDEGSNSTVLTLGDFSNGVMAQSIGGGGGNAGLGSGTTENYGGSTSASASIGLGSSGGSGGRGYDARINLKSGSQVTTYGDGSNGLLVQAIGGGGGTSQGGTLSLGASYSAKIGRITEGSSESKLALKGNLDATLGATGGGGGNGGAAFVAMSDKVTTFGNDSTGVLVQSIGGGGGVAGAAGAFASPDVPWLPDGTNYKRAKKIFNRDISVKLDLDFSADLSLGSLGSGASGSGGNATFDDLGGAQVDTSGDWSSGIILQSIGGGGGKVGSAVATGQGASNQIDLHLGGTGVGSSQASANGANGSQAMALLDGTRIRSGLEGGYSSFGLVLQSIGGGGGIAADNSDSATGSIAVGSALDSFTDQNGKVIGNGGEAELSGNANIETFGVGGHAVVMQSIGAGGGIGGAGTSSENAFASSINLQVGGNALSSGSGGQVTINENSVLTLATNNDHSYGILAQSIGGGGGLGAVVDPQFTSIAGTQSATGGTSRSEGGNVTLSLGASSIVTSGLNSHGVVAQSIGAGGGIAGYSSGGNFQVSNPSGSFGYGDGGDVAIALNSDGSIQTRGTRAHGILAQSIGGGGGIVNGVAGRSNKDGSGSAGNVSVQVDGNISVTGDGSYAIFAQQDAPNFNGGKSLYIRVGGRVQSRDTAVVIESENGTLQIDQGGEVEGPVAIQRVGESTNLFNVVNDGALNGSITAENLPVSGSGVRITTVLVNTGEFIAGPSIQANVTNKGLVRIGQLTRQQGDFIQQSSGTLLFETDFASDMDAGAMTDISAQRSSDGDLAATVAPPVENGSLVIDGDADLSGQIQVAGTNVNGNREVELLRVRNGEFLNDLTVDNGSARLFNYQLRQSGNRVLLRAVADFSPDDLKLSKNAVSAGDYLERAFQAQGNEGLVGLFATLEQLAIADGQAYEDALNQLTPGAATAMVSRELWAQQALADMALGQKVLRGDSSKPVEVQGMWAKASGEVYSGEGYDIDSYSSMLGGQWEAAPNFFIGGAIGYRTDNLKADNGTVSGDGDALLGALTVKYEPGDWSFAAALTGSTSSSDVNRRISIPGQNTQLDGSPDYNGVGFFGQVGYTFHNDLGYIRPMFTAGVVHVSADSYSERGASNLRLKINGESQTALVVTPGVEAGIRTNLPNGMTLRSYASGGLSFSTADEWSQKARFSQGPAGIGSFSTSLPIDDVVLNVTSGFQLQITERVSGYIQYQGEFSEDFSNNGGGIGVTMEF